MKIKINSIIIGIICVGSFGKEPLVMKHNVQSVAKASKAMNIFYLSPKILTRSNMTPERLNHKEYEIVVNGSVQSEIVKLRNIILSSKHVKINDVKSKYDFRLFLPSKEVKICIDVSGCFAIIDNNLYALSAEEKTIVIEIFRQLDQDHP